MPSSKVPPHSGATKFKRNGKLVGYRAQVTDPSTGKKVAANMIVHGRRGEIFPPNTAGRNAARALCWQAEAKLGANPGDGVTVDQLRGLYLARTHGRSGKLKESTQIVNAERTKRLADEWAERRIDSITDDEARAWAATANSGERSTCKTLFTFAVEQGLLPYSPFRFVAVNKGRGNEEIDPPTPEQIDKLVAAAHSILPSYGDWLAFGRWVGTRPGETDTLRFSDFEEDFRYVRIRRQWNQTAQKITAPKHNRTHRIAVPDGARAIVKARFSELVKRSDVVEIDALVFTNTRGQHFTQTSRAYYWKAATAAAGVTHTDAGEKVTPYLVTRHFCGWYMTNVLARSCQEVASQLRHGDGGTLVRQLYGHLDADMAAERNLRAFDEHRRQTGGA